MHQFPRLSYFCSHLLSHSLRGKSQNFHLYSAKSRRNCKRNHLEQKPCWWPHCGLCRTCWLRPPSEPSNQNQNLQGMVKRSGHKTGWNWINRVEWGGPGAPFSNQSIQRFTKRNTSMISQKTKDSFFVSHSIIQKKIFIKILHTVLYRKKTFVANLYIFKCQISRPLGC